MLPAITVTLDDALGVSSTIGPDGLDVDGRRIPPTVRRARDLLGQGLGIVVRHRQRLERAVARGDDPVLYRAYRSALPERTTGAFTWRADVVQYEGGILASGEPHRSIGHWNLADEWELFQVIDGVVMMVEQPYPQGHVNAWCCLPGDIVILPPGSWHLTYAPAGQPIVLNIYSLTASRTAHLHDGRVKYLSRTAASPPVTAAMEDGEPILFNGAMRLGSKTSAPRPRTDSILEQLLSVTRTSWLGTCFTRTDLAIWHSLISTEVPR